MEGAPHGLKQGALRAPPIMSSANKSCFWFTASQDPKPPKHLCLYQEHPATMKTAHLSLTCLAGTGTRSPSRSGESRPGYVRQNWGTSPQSSSLAQ